jgi:hypothetical protein
MAKWSSLQQLECRLMGRLSGGMGYFGMVECLGSSVHRAAASVAALWCFAKATLSQAASGTSSRRKIFSPFTIICCALQSDES